MLAEVKAKHGRIDVLFLNAGIAQFAPLEGADEAHFDRQFNTNVKGLYFTIQKALPLLVNGASVIITSSVAASVGQAHEGAGISVFLASDESSFMASSEVVVSGGQGNI